MEKDDIFETLNGIFDKPDISTLLDKAEKNFRENKYDLSCVHLIKALKINPDLPKCFRYLNSLSTFVEAQDAGLAIKIYCAQSLLIYSFEKDNQRFNNLKKKLNQTPSLGDSVIKIYRKLVKASL